jgi:hypothetical protein
MMDAPHHEVEIFSRASAGFHYCGSELYLAARIPHPGWDTRSGRRGTGSRIIGLCPRCHAGDPASHALLAYFAFHDGAVDADSIEEFGLLLDIWLATPRPTGVTDDLLDQDIENWQHERSSGG